MAENDVWTIKAALDWTVGYLERKGDENPRISAQWLLSEATGLRRIELYTHFEQPLSMEERDVLRDYVARRGAGEPLQYITGEVGFRHIAVKVRPGVLIPRPETEVLVSEGLACLPVPPRPRAAEDAEDSEAAGEGETLSAENVVLGPEDNPRLAHGASANMQGFAHEVSQGVAGDGVLDSVAGKAPAVPGLAVSPDETCAGMTFSETDASSEKEPSTEADGPLVADLCTGSGCIACSIAYEHPLSRVVATDIAPEAVTLARDNAVALGLDDRVEVIACDLGEGIDQALMGCFDLVVSNPPYVPTSVLDDIPREVADYEPNLALDGGDDGLDIFRRLLPFCERALKPGGSFAFELHETCLEDAARLATDAGFVDVRIVEDLAQRPRVLVARRSA